MSYEPWLNLIRTAEKSSILSGKIRKIHYKFPDGKEMAEEYNLETGIVQRRAWKKTKELMGEPQWDIELGEPLNPLNRDNQNFTVRESNSEPILTKRITKKNIEWRIRNLPHSIDVYQVTADTDKKCITVRTTNKKYFKNIFVPEFDRCAVIPQQEDISIHHQYNTLIITYKKPKLLCEMEIEVLKILQDVETETDMDDLLRGLMNK